MRTFLLAALMATMVLAQAQLADARGRRNKKRRSPSPASKKVTPGPAIPAAVPAPESSDDADAEPGIPQAVAEGASGGKKRVQVLDFEGFGVEGRLRTPQLLYFLTRVREELARASLENRSFLPELQRSVTEGGL